MDCVFHKTTTMLCWQDSVLNPAVDWTRPRTVYVKKGGRDLQSGTLGEGMGGEGGAGGSRLHVGVRRGRASAE